MLMLLNFQPIELLHAYITPYTVKKNLKTVQPMSKASNLNQIVSKNQLKKVSLYEVLKITLNYDVELSILLY